jgi:uncharacterized C2H2 Zn-finger protein
LPEFVCAEKVHKKRGTTVCGMKFEIRKDFDEHMKRVHGYRKWSLPTKHLGKTLQKRENCATGQ